MFKSKKYKELELDWTKQNAEIDKLTAQKNRAIIERDEALFAKVQLELKIKDLKEQIKKLKPKKKEKKNGK